MIEFKSELPQKQKGLSSLILMITILQLITILNFIVKLCRFTTYFTLFLSLNIKVIKNLYYNNFIYYFS